MATQTERIDQLVTSVAEVAAGQRVLVETVQDLVIEFREVKGKVDILNGHKAALYALADASTVLVAIAEREQDRRAAGRWLRRFWQHPLGKVASVLSAPVAWVVVSHYLGGHLP